MIKLARQRGQTMILTVMILTSAILSATAISALLVLFQLRQASDIKASMQAIFAADAGGENYSNCNTSEIGFINGASYAVTFDESGENFKSIGRAGRVARAVEVGF